MKVPSLNLYSKFIAIDKDGGRREVSDTWVTGCFKMCAHLKEKFGIKTVPSTVYNGKKEFTPLTFPYGRTKEYYLAYFNWVLNFPREERAEFFESEPDIGKFYKNNPIVDVVIIVKKNH